MRAWLFVLVGTVGCDQVFDLTAPPRLDSGTDLDASEPCAIGGVFLKGEPVSIGGSNSVEAARFNAPQSVAYLSLCMANDKSTCELYTSPFNLETQKFVSFAKLTGVSAANYYDSYPTISPDGEHLIYGSRRVDGTLRVWVATAQNSSFDQPTFSKLALPPTASSSNEPYILADGTTLYMGAGVTSTGYDLFRMHGAAPTFGAAPVGVPGVNTAADEAAPVVSDDELEIFFASNRLPTGSGNGLDIYTATRDAPGASFKTPTRVMDLSVDASFDWPLWLSPDRCTLYYINKDAQTELAVLYVTSRR